MAFISGLSNLNAMTREMVRDNVVDNIFTGDQYLYSLRANNSVMIRGGTKLRSQVMVNTGAARSFSDYDNLDTSDINFAVEIEEDWKSYFSPIVYSESDRLKNSSPEAIVDLIETKKRHAEMDLVATIGDDLAGDGTGNNSKAILGYLATLSTTSTLHGLAPATYPTWKAKIDSTTTALTLQAMDKIIGDLTIGSQGPTDIICQKEVYFRKMMTLVRSAVTQNTNAVAGKKSRLMADAGFVVIDHMGIPVWFDDNVPGSGGSTSDNYILFPNMNRYFMYIHSEDNFTFRDFVPAVNQRAAAGFLFVTLNMFCEERRTQGAMTTIDPAT